MKDRQWHALHVRRRFERIVAFHLHNQNIENYLPLLRLSGQSGDGMHFVESPLFPGYVFFKCEAGRSLWTIPGVLSVVRRANAIDGASEQEISDLKRIVNAGLPVQSWPFRSDGTTVIVKNGSLSGATGILEQISSKRFLIFSIPLIHCSVAIEVDESHIVSLGARGAS